MQCSSCGKPSTIRTWEGYIERYGIEIAAHGKRCRECGETLFDLAEMKRQERAIAKQLAMRGVRTGSEFRLVRKVAGLRAVDVAAMLDVTPETVSRWERAYVLGDRLEHPKLARERLGAFARQAGRRRSHAQRPGRPGRTCRRWCGCARVVTASGGTRPGPTSPAW
jgi:hypothetical protein